MRSKHATMFASLLLSAALLTSCSAAQHIEDTNGEDTALCSLAEDDLIAKKTSSLSFMSVMNEANGATELSIDRFSGVKDVVDFRLEQGEQVAFRINSTLNSGNMRIYLYSDGNILLDFAIGQEVEQVFKAPASNRYYIRVAGESADFELQVAKL